MAAMLALALALAAGGAAPEVWSCTSRVEVWCDAATCTARPEAETTPLAVGAGPGGHFSVCAYTGCWEGSGRIHRQDGRILVTADAVPFSTSEGGAADVSLLIVTGDGTGFVRAGGLATPLVCRRAAP